MLNPVILVDMDATLCLNTTGRPYFGEIIAATKKWLAKHDIIVDELFFRPVKDYSPGADCKKKIYEDNIKGKYNVQFVLEDNYKCGENKACNLMKESSNGNISRTILKQFDPDREVVIHTLKGENVDVNGYLTDLDVIPRD